MCLPLLDVVIIGGVHDKPDQPMLLVAYDRLGPRQAGPAIRTIALARQLASIGPVEVVYEGEPPSLSETGISFIPHDSIKPSSDFFNGYRLALAPPLIALVLPELLESECPLVVDLFDPIVFENLELHRASHERERAFQHERHLAALLAGLLRGDYFLAAGKRQMDLFCGALMALNRINPSTWQTGRGPEQIIGLVPFGLPDEPPPSAEEVPLPKEFDYGGPLVVWGGGMWEWLRPEVVVRGWPEVLGRYPSARLVFPGTEHPNPHVPRMASVGRVKKLAHDLGVAQSLSFGRWLTRGEYLGLLAHSGAGVSTHESGLEARYAARTRFLDAIWMGLPQVVSVGDEYAEYISDRKLGVALDILEPSAFAEAILRVLESGRESYADRFVRARQRLTWSRMARPLVEWAKSPRITHGPGGDFFRATLGEAAPRRRPRDLGSVLRRVLGRLGRG